VAVYTHVAEEELEAFLAAYDIGAPTAFKGIAEGVENSNFFLQTERGRFILTLYEKRVRPSDLPFFLALMAHVTAAGVPCPAPVAARTGEVLGELNGRPAVLITFLDGVALTLPKPAHCRALGETAARLHNAVADFKLDRPNDLSTEGWSELAEACGPRADEIAPDMQARLKRTSAGLAAKWPTDLPRGVIHADLFPDNVFFLKERVSGVIDFYFACTDFFAYDLAICLNAWCFDAEHVFAPLNAAALFEGYLTRRSLSPAERTAMPILAQGAALRFLLTRTYDWLNHVDGALVSPKDPKEYLAKLLFHERVSSPADYGL